ncbi:MAG TPA: carbonic anhydrase [Candidatus Nanoarchaeia archaeon]|nr:hypothetical protein [uncultured archaeon]
MKKSPDESIEALVIRCIDYRFVTQSREFKEAKGWINQYDLLTFPGASKNIHHLFDAIEISNRLHQPKKIVIMDHEDCGAFGEDDSFEDHRRSLKKAEKLLNVVFPEIPVELYYVKFSGVEKI